MSESPEQEADHYGRATAELVADAYASGVDRAVLLMRHSARTFRRDIHDLENPLTDHGRALSSRLGAALPKDVHVRGYASPPERCMETARLMIDAHTHAGGSAGRTRPVEALGVFYALDQQRMWKGLSLAESLPAYVGEWFAGAVPEDAMMPADLAVRMILTVLVGKLKAPGAARQLDLCVSHDMTVFTMRHGLGLESVHGPPVEFLDGLLLCECDGALTLKSHHGAEVEVTP